MSIADAYVPHISVIFAVLMIDGFYVLLFPFLAYLFFFLDPKKVVSKIMLNGLKAAADSINDQGNCKLVWKVKNLIGRNVTRHQVKATLAIEHLMDAGSSALRRRDKNISADIVDALCSFSMAYGHYKVIIILFYHFI